MRVPKLRHPPEHDGMPRGADRRKSPRKRYTSVVRTDATRSCATRNTNARASDNFSFPGLGGWPEAFKDLDMSERLAGGA
jgi:hypothetical protein